MPGNGRTKIVDQMEKSEKQKSEKKTANGKRNY